MRSRLPVLIVVLTAACSAEAPSSVPETVLPRETSALTAESVRERTEREWSVKAEKMREHLLPLMRRHDIDLWAIISRENAPDPVLELFGGHGITGWYGHRNAYLLYDAGEDGLETTVIGTHLSGHMSRFFDTVRSYGEEGLRPHLQQYIATRSPARIAINQSRTISMADGLTAELKGYLVSTVGPEMAGSLVSSEPLLIDYVSVHTPAEDEIETEAAQATYEILRRAMSSDVITPGETTLMDVHYWITAERKRRNFEFVFPASLDLQRYRDGQVVTLTDADDPVIERGDLLHVDFGVRQSGIVTDQQKMAYVLMDGETAPPAGLVQAFADSARAAEIHAAAVEPGRTGIEIKTQSEDAAAVEGLDLLVYSHVQGYWVHDANTWTTFDWPERYGLHPRLAIQGGEWFSLEFQTRTAVPEWGDQVVSIMREEDMKIPESGPLRYLAGPQTELWVVR